MANRRLRTEMVEMARGLQAIGALDGESLRQLTKLAGRDLRVVHAPEPLLASGVLPPNRVKLRERLHHRQRSSTRRARRAPHRARAEKVGKARLPLGKHGGMRVAWCF